MMVLFRNAEGQITRRACLVRCPTGVAAFKVGGKHCTAFGVQTIAKSFVFNGVEEKQSLFRDAAGLIIDEMSMCGCSLLGQVYNACNNCFISEKHQGSSAITFS